MLKCAYVFAVINAATRQVVKTLILGEETPTVTKPLEVYALLFKVYGRDMKDARKKVQHRLETSAYDRWIHDLLAN